MKVSVWVLGFTAMVLVVVELSMQPDAADRLTLIGLFGSAAAVSLLIASAAGRWTDNTPSVRRAMLWPLLIAIVVSGSVVVASAHLMFISSHDRNVTLAALGLGAGLGVAVYLQLSSRLRRDLQSLGRAARMVSGGDRSARSGVLRRDELGTAATAFDDMVGQIGASETAQRKLFASLGHDLRTPLTALRAATEALQDGVARDADCYLRAMIADIDALSGLVDDLMLMAKVETGRYRPSSALVDLAGSCRCDHPGGCSPPDHGQRSCERQHRGGG